MVFNDMMKLEYEFQLGEHDLCPCVRVEGDEKFFCEHGASK